MSGSVPLNANELRLQKERASMARIGIQQVCDRGLDTGNLIVVDITEGVNIFMGTGTDVSSSPTPGTDPGNIHFIAGSNMG